MSCENEEVNLNSVELEQNLNLEESKLEENKREDQKNFNSITYKNNTYSIAEVYDNEELLDMYMNAKITYSEATSSNESQKENIFIYDSEDEFNDNHPEPQNNEGKTYIAQFIIDFYEHANYRGARFRRGDLLKKGQLIRGNMPSSFNDRTSSISIKALSTPLTSPGVFRVALRENFNQRGRLVVYRRSNNDFRRQNFNDKASSYQVYRAQ